jgi:predicted porin
MKKMACVAALCAVGAVHAQELTLYGIVDGGVVHTTGLKSGAKTVMSSGIMEGSRWGLRGQEDLGGGYTALFNFESRVEITNGGVSSRPLSGLQLPDRATVATLMGLPAAYQPYVTAVAGNIANQEAGTNLPERLFDRQSHLALITPVGGLFLGRLYTPSAAIAGIFDIMQTQSSLSAGQVLSIPSGIDLRVSNALSYRIKQGQWAGSLLYGFGGTAKGDTVGRTMGASVIYQSGAYSAGAAYTTRDNELGQQSLTTAVLGGASEWGASKLSVLYAEVRDPNPTGLSTIAAALPAAVGPAVQNAFINVFKQDGSLIHVGYRHQFGPHTLFAVVNSFNDRTSAKANTDTYGVGWTYSLSKRTDLNAIYSHFDNKNLAQTAPGQGGFLGGVTAKAGQGADSYAIGIRHRF